MGHFNQILAAYGRDVTWMQLEAGGSRTDKGSIKAIVEPLKKEALLHEPNFVEFDYQQAYTSAALAFGDQLVFDSKTWDVESVKNFSNAALAESFYVSVIKTRRKAP